MRFRSGGSPRPGACSHDRPVTASHVRFAQTPNLEEAGHALRIRDHLRLLDPVGSGPRHDAASLRSWSGALRRSPGRPDRRHSRADALGRRPVHQRAARLGRGRGRLDRSPRSPGPRLDRQDQNRFRYADVPVSRHRHAGYPAGAGSQQARGSLCPDGRRAAAPAATSKAQPTAIRADHAAGGMDDARADNEGRRLVDA